MLLWLAVLPFLAAHALRVVEMPPEPASCQSAEAYAVYGAFGELGQNLLQFLKPTPHKIRVIYRPGQLPTTKDEEASNVEYVLNTNLQEAFSNLQGAFIVPHLPYQTTNDFLEESNAKLDELVAALRLAKVPKIVLVSSIGAHLDPKLHQVGSIASSYYAEQKFKSAFASSSSTQLVFVRSAWNLENFRALAKAVSKTQGVLPSFFPADLQVEMMSNYDLAYCMAQFMLNERVQGKLVLVKEIAMKTPLTTREIAQEVAKALGKTEVQPVGVPEDMYPKLLSYMGQSALREWRISLEAYRNGLLQFESPTTVMRVKTRLEEIVKVWF